MDIHELQQTILKLSPKEFKLLRDWFLELDKQNEADVKAGQMDEFIVKISRKKPVHIMSPRLVNRKQASEFKMKVEEKKK